MKTIEEIKKFFPNHKFEDDFDLKLIQFTAEDLIDFSEDYAKKVAIASLEKASNNLRQASGSFNSDFYSQKRKYSFMKTLELKLKKDVLIVDLPIDAKNIYMSGDSVIFNTNKSCIIKSLNGNYESLCKGSELTEEIASELCWNIGNSLTIEGNAYLDDVNDLYFWEYATDAFITIFYHSHV